MSSLIVNFRYVFPITATKKCSFAISNCIVAFECTQRITGWDQKAVEVRSLQATILENELKRRSIKKLRFLCSRGDKV